MEEDELEEEEEEKEEEEEVVFAIWSPQQSFPSLLKH